VSSKRQDEYSLDKVELVGLESRSDGRHLTNQQLVHHERVIESQQNISEEVLKGIEEQENCCIEVQSGIFSVKDQIESKKGPLDFPFNGIFGVGSVTFFQMLFQKLKGGFLISFSLTIIFAILYLMGGYYIKIYSVYSQNEKGDNTATQQNLTCFGLLFMLLFFLRYTMCMGYLFSFTVSLVLKK